MVAVVAESSALSELLARPAALPALPRAIRELTTLLDSEEVSLDAVVRLLGAEPGLAMRVLRLANSSFYGRTRAVESVADAVLLIGLAALKVLVLGSGITAAVRLPESLARGHYWRHCLHTAVGARYFAVHAQVDPQAAFTAGLVHAIGEPILGQQFGAELRRLDERLPFYDGERAEGERQRLGVGYPEVGAELARRWHFPATLVEAIRAAPEPLREAPFNPYAGCVYLARHLASDTERKRNPQESCATLDARVLDQLGLSAEVAFAMPPYARLSQGLETLFS
ncbi:MAG TPA: HDOD domain-containing protein [Nevskiaceae bacterium]|nr:HDOD domain-containing protein [Nevskiaceae bacterium]